jgi:hypothetical protein
MVSEHRETRVETSVATLPELVKMVAHEALVVESREGRFRRWRVR